MVMDWHFGDRYASVGRIDMAIMASIKPSG